MELLSRTGFYLNRAHYLFIEFLQQKLQGSGLGDDIKPGMGNIMMALFEKDNQTMTELAQRLHLSKTTIGRMVKEVAKFGLVESTPSAQDKRATQVTLTVKGASLQEGYLAFVEEVESALVRGLEEQEIETLNTLLARIIDDLRESITALK